MVVVVVVVGLGVKVSVDVSERMAGSVAIVGADEGDTAVVGTAEEGRKLKAGI